MIIVSLIFALAHTRGELGIFLYGLFFAALYEKTESLIATFVAHSTNNLLAITAVLFMIR
jgi:membrane protease YdiL (CAAX protease family)